MHARIIGTTADSIDAMHAGKHVIAKANDPFTTERAPQVKAQKPQEPAVGARAYRHWVTKRLKSCWQAVQLVSLYSCRRDFGQARRGPVGAWQYPIPCRCITANSWLGYLYINAFVWWKALRRNYTDWVQVWLAVCSPVQQSLHPLLLVRTGRKNFLCIRRFNTLWNDGREVPDVLLAPFDYGKKRGSSGI